jgi:hypothetical protein
LVLKPAVARSDPAPDVFSVTGLVKRIGEALFDLPDHRQGGNNQSYAIGDAALSAFSAFFLPSPSFPDDQRRIQKEHGENNASALFGVHRIPSTQQIGNLLDPISADQLAPVFFELIEALHRHDALGNSRKITHQGYAAVG